MNKYNVEYMGIDKRDAYNLTIEADDIDMAIHIAICSRLLTTDILVCVAEIFE